MSGNTNVTEVKLIEAEFHEDKMKGLLHLKFQVPGNDKPDEIWLSGRTVFEMINEYFSDHPVKDAKTWEVFKGYPAELLKMARTNGMGMTNVEPNSLIDTGFIGEEGQSPFSRTPQ